ncbi:ABC-type phosphate transport system periplasmic component-like protein [Alkaliphilus metalliredigens QYMF]|uniref:ABC-type phosphate transport system periplasmic component-like protein n=1 Tax=Alkaliphilus metalliredigens (strain QYMF) TaxID=293826 RepID=A6TSB4_ALKMQ|nr:substrate-binding domain-containing protein [Alkaliphilus metalliredigens]ABR49082.1 ABC-type phosphate transport system periplasmic component-like protein [Alkaliphilus metalliredigens QYMF]
MTPTKNYIKSCLALPMLLIPLILTLALTLSLQLASGQLLPDSMGRETRRLIYLLMAFTIPLLIGGGIGFMFKKSIKNKITSMKGIYIASMVPILYTLIFATLAIVMGPHDYNSTWWGIYFFKNPAFSIFHLILFFGNFQYLAIVAELMGYTGFALGIHLHEFLSKAELHHESLFKTRKAYVLALIIPLFFSGLISREKISNGIIELRYGESTISKDLNEYDLYQIAPFKEGNGLARLDKPASLQFNDFDTMPRLDGATAAYPVYAAFVQEVYQGLGEHYEKHKNSHEKDVYTAFVSSEEEPFDIIKCTKTGTAYERLINGETDIIFVAEPSQGHIELAKVKGEEFNLVPIGYEAFVFFTNARNPVDNLTIKEIQEIYAGKITNWREVGGENRSILPYQRPENSGSQTVMENQVMQEIQMLPPTETTYAGGMGDIITQVAGYKNARNCIGYSFMYYSSEMINNNQIKHISVNGIGPSSENIRNKTYPFTVPVYAVTLKSNEDENVKRFVEWVLSDEGQSLVEQTGYVGK